MSSYKNIMRDYAKIERPQKKHKWLTPLIIIVTVIAFAFPFALRFFKNTESKTKTTHSAVVSKKKSAPKIKKESANDLPSFDFYNLLPQMEVSATSTQPTGLMD